MRTYEEEVAAARKRLDQNLAATAADVLVLAERFGKKIPTVVKDVTRDQPELFKAVESRSYRMQKATSGADSGASSTPIEVRRARSDMQRPGVAEAVLSDPEIRERVEEVLATTPIAPNLDGESSYSIRHIIKKGLGFVQYAQEALLSVADLTPEERIDLAKLHLALTELLPELNHLVEEGQTRMSAELNNILGG